MTGRQTPLVAAMAVPIHKRKHRALWCWLDHPSVPYYRWPPMIVYWN